MAVWDFPLFLITYRYLYSGNKSSTFGTNLKNFAIRRYACSLTRLNAISIANSRTNSLLSSRCTRFLTRPAGVHESTILGSPRYRQYRYNLYHLVSCPTFVRYWILQSSLAEIRPLCALDITIFYLHGGGYFSFQPAMYLLFLLRLAESLLDQGLSVSIFAFDYPLAPEYPFPAQLRDATAAYSCLLDEV